VNEFVTFLSEVFEKFGAVQSRKMFGGYGVFHEGLMFGLVADDELYLKVDQQTLSDFEAKGLSPFAYDKNGKTMNMSYYLAPEEIYDDPDEATIWANKAFEAALRSKKPKLKKK